jgi:DNA-binding response OmpR family regulator
MTKAMTILCVEDDRETAVLTSEELVERGYRVIVAYDGRKGLQRFSRKRPI